MSTLFPATSGLTPKVIIGAGQLPGYVAALQAPTKRPPWRTIRQVSYVDSVTVILPDDLYRTVWDGVETEMSRPKYAKVIMKLEDVLKGDFFTKYIKKGGWDSMPSPTQPYHNSETHESDTGVYAQETFS